MIRTLAEVPTTQPLAADICIIGAGAAGLALASEFANTHYRVVVLESGTASRSGDSDELNETIVAGVPHSGSTEGRARTLGGATTLWGGQVLPLRESETRSRPWVPHSGWPFGPATLEPYYRRVEPLLGTPGPPYGDEAWGLLGVPAPALDRDRYLYRFSQWAPLTRRNMALALRTELKSSRNVDVLLGATVVNVVPARDGGHVAHVDIVAAGGKPRQVRARAYVVCCGGIETPRLLLASGGRRGIANRSGLVGRFFQDHISCIAGVISEQSRSAVRRYFEPRYRGGAMYTCKIEPTDRALTEHGLLNVMAHVKFEIPEALGLLELKRMLNDVQRGRLPIPSLRSAIAMTRGAAEFARLAFARAALSRRAAPTRGRLLLMVDVEQAPNPDSRIRLADETDRLGMPKAVVDWRLSGLETRTITQFTAMLARDWERAGLGTVEVVREVDFAACDVLGAARDIYHHMGATRLSESPRDGVVDVNLRSHEVDNLYVASGSVFPTGGIANPTFTILALALRLADRLKVVLARDNESASAHSFAATTDVERRERRKTSSRPP